MSPLTAAQLEMRRQGIGSSEAPAVAGLNPYKNAHHVFKVKTGREMDDGPTDATEIGHAMEPIIGGLVSERKGLDLVRGDTHRHPDHDWVMATPDFETRDGLTGVEAKVVGARMAHQWGTEDDAAPPYVLGQVQWQAFVRGWKRIIIGAVIGGTEFRTYDIPADPEFQQLLLARNKHFWFENVLKDVPPPTDGSASCSDLLATLFPRDEAPIIEAPQHGTLVEALMHARNAVDLAEEAKAEIENRLKALIGNASGIRGEGWSVSWKASKPSRKTDWQAVALAMGPASDIIERYTEVRPGSRRFLPRFTDKE